MTSYQRAGVGLEVKRLSRLPIEDAWYTCYADRVRFQLAVQSQSKACPSSWDFTRAGEQMWRRTGMTVGPLGPSVRRRWRKDKNLCDGDDEGSGSGFIVGGEAKFRTSRFMLTNTRQTDGEKRRGSYGPAARISVWVPQAAGRTLWPASPSGTWNGWGPPPPSPSGCTGRTEAGEHTIIQLFIHS